MKPRLKICLFVGLSVGMKGGVAQGRVPIWGEVMREPLAKRGPVVAYTPKLEGPVFGEGESLRRYQPWGGPLLLSLAFVLGWPRPGARGLQRSL